MSPDAFRYVTIQCRANDLHIRLIFLHPFQAIECPSTNVFHSQTNHVPEYSNARKM